MRKLHRTWNTGPTTRKCGSACTVDRPCCCVRTAGSTQLTREALVRPGQEEPLERVAAEGGADGSWGREEGNDAKNGVRDAIVDGKEKVDESGEEKHRDVEQCHNDPLRQPRTGGTSAPVRVCARAAWSESGTEQAASSVEPTAARPVAARTHIDGSKVLEREHYESI